MMGLVEAGLMKNHSVSWIAEKIIKMLTRSEAFIYLRLLAALVWDCGNCDWAAYAFFSDRQQQQQHTDKPKISRF